MRVEVVEINLSEIDNVWVPVFENRKGELEAVKVSQAPVYNPDGSRDVYVGSLRSVVA